MSSCTSSPHGVLSTGRRREGGKREQNAGSLAENDSCASAGSNWRTPSEGGLGASSLTGPFFIIIPSTIKKKYKLYTDPENFVKF